MKKGFVFIITVFIISLNSIAQSAGIFPGQPFNGMQVNYTITGATVSKFTDVPGFTWTRSLVITDIQKGSVLGISGSLQAGGLGCTVIVSVSAGGQPSSHQYEVVPGTPKSFKEQVQIPKDAKSASISINMNGHYSMGGGSRGVVVRGDWDGKWGNVTKPPEPDKYKPAPSEVAVLKNILKIYGESIPNGIVSNGPLNNKNWWLNKKKYDDYVCGGYQGKVLTVLDGLKFSNNPAEKKLLEGYDYGPVKVWYGVTPGGHRAVVIYPKGSDWRKTGIILDPWPEQKAKSYTMDEWRKLFPHDVKPDNDYKGQYPISGGTGYSNNPNRIKLPTEVAIWFQSLSKERQEAYKQIKDESEYKRRINMDYADRNKDGRVMANCPLSLYITDETGRISGFPDGIPRSEIRDVTMTTFRLADGTFWTELSYPSNRNFRIMLKGTGNGPAEVYTGFNMQDDPGNSTVYKYSFQVNNGQEYALGQQTENSAIQIINPSKNKKAVINGVRISGGQEDGEGMIDPGQEVKIFDNGNIYGVTNGPSSPTRFILNKATFISRIEDYHYFNNGRLPGTIALVNAKGQQFGPWYATGTNGQGGVQNAYWVVRPNMTLPAGTYTVIDSDPATWSTNGQSANKGFTTVWATGLYIP
ncbi:MAG: hypothetical protein WAT34_04440 [Chitinophagaceae bacterium]